MELSSFFTELDVMFKTRTIKEAELFIEDNLKRAQEEKDLPSLLAIANELGGVYRVTNRYAEAKKIYEIALQLIKVLKLENTQQHGTTLLNLASVYGEADEILEAKKLYEKAASIYVNAGLGADYPMAALYNNISHTYEKLSMPEEALAYAKKSLNIINNLPGYDVELATTCTTLAASYMRLRKYEEATRYLKEAERIFSSMPGKLNVHYAATLNSLGEILYRKGNLTEAADHYQRALEIIRDNYGENKAFAEVAGNLEKIRKANQLVDKRMTGMEIAEAYYEQCGREMLKHDYSAYLQYMAVGLVGEGSECYGFDDTLSESHDFGPGFCIWLPEDIYQKIGKELKYSYESLPKNFRNKSRIETEEGKGRVGVFSIGSFYRKYTGSSEEPKNNVEWLYAPETSFSTVTNGKVFMDNLGDFSRIRSELMKFYPRDILLKKVAARMAMMSQAGQYNYSRCMDRGEYAAAYISCSEFIKNTVSLVYLLNRKYMPFYKWMFKGMDSLGHIKEIKPLLESLISVPDKPENKVKKAKLIEDICILIRDELTRQGIINGKDAFLNNHCGYVISQIADPKIRNLPVMFDGR